VRRWILRASAFGLLASAMFTVARLDGLPLYEWSTIAGVVVVSSIAFVAAARASMLAPRLPAAGAVSEAVSQLLKSQLAPSDWVTSYIMRLGFPVPLSWKATRVAPSLWSLRPPHLGNAELRIRVTAPQPPYLDTTLAGQVRNLTDFLSRDGLKLIDHRARRVFGRPGLRAYAAAPGLHTLTFFCSLADGDYQLMLVASTERHLQLLRPVAEAFLLCCSLVPAPSSQQSDRTDVMALLSEAFEARRLAVFCGAGISADSGVPLVKPLIEQLMLACGAAPADAKVVKDAAMPFEAFMEAVFAHSDPSAILEVFRSHAPNAQHALLAELAGKGLLDLIVTTNFDELIERVGTSLRVTRTIEELAAWKPRGPELVKIHGCISDVRDLAITTSQVARHINVKARQEVLRHIFSTGPHEVVWIIGYGAGDEYDIMPCIRGIEGPRKKVILMDHVDIDAEPVITRLEDPSAISRFGPDISGFRVTCNVSAFMFKMARHLFNPEDYEVKRSTAWQAQIELYVAQNRTARGAFGDQLVGRVLVDAGEPGRAIPYLERALTNARVAAVAPAELATILVGYGAALRGAARSSAAETTLREALKLLSNQGARADCYCTLGAAVADQQRFDEAAELFGQGEVAARASDDSSRLARSLGGLGAALSSCNRPQAAISSLEEGRQIAAEIGDKTAEGTALINLARAYATMGQAARAEYCFEQGLPILEVALGPHSPVVHAAAAALIGSPR
jgi:tetratricopeptide (TPR) repeat protein